VRPSIVPFLHSKRTAAARSLVSRYGRLNVLSGFQVNHSWTYPIAKKNAHNHKIRSARALNGRSLRLRLARFRSAGEGRKLIYFSGYGTSEVVYFIYYHFLSPTPNP